METTGAYQQSFFNSLLYWDPWTPDANTLELPAEKKAPLTFAEMKIASEVKRG